VILGSFATPDGHPNFCGGVKACYRLIVVRLRPIHGLPGHARHGLSDALDCTTSYCVYHHNIYNSSSRIIASHTLVDLRPHCSVAQVIAVAPPILYSSSHFTLSDVLYLAGSGKITCLVLALGDSYMRPARWAKETLFKMTSPMLP